jgi:hypothetical protein
MELSEFVPANRFEKDAIIRQLRRDIISKLDLGEHTRGFVVNISLPDDYATRFRPGRIHADLDAALNEFFAGCDTNRAHYEVPARVESPIAQIRIFKEDLTGDPRLEDDREPLIVFGAQSTMLVPEEDCPTIVESRLSRKGLHNLACPTWLLLWSHHDALSSLRNELDAAIGHYLLARPMAYERVFHLHLFAGSGATEFPRPRAP